MTDISKCHGFILPKPKATHAVECKKKLTCFRFTAPTNLHWQAYMRPTMRDGLCPYFYAIKENTNAEV